MGRKKSCKVFFSKMPIKGRKDVNCVSKTLNKSPMSTKQKRDREEEMETRRIIAGDGKKKIKKEKGKDDDGDDDCRIVSVTPLSDKGKDKAKEKRRDDDSAAAAEKKKVKKMEDVVEFTKDNLHALEHLYDNDDDGCDIEAETIMRMVKKVLRKLQTVKTSGDDFRKNVDEGKEGYSDYEKYWEGCWDE